MSIRFRLTIAAIAVILVANSLLSFLALQYLGGVWMGEVQTRVRRNLNSARAAYQSHVDVIAVFLRATARASHTRRCRYTKRPAGSGSEVARPWRVENDGLCRLDGCQGKGDLPVGKPAVGGRPLRRPLGGAECCASARLFKGRLFFPANGCWRKGPSWPLAPLSASSQPRPPAPPPTLFAPTGW